MKNLTLLFIALFVVSIFASCGSSNTRKNCKGNGGWYGNRNLGAIDLNKENSLVKGEENAKTYFVQQNDAPSF